MMKSELSSSKPVLENRKLCIPESTDAPNELTGRARTSTLGVCGVVLLGLLALSVFLVFRLTASPSVLQNESTDFEYYDLVGRNLLSGKGWDFNGEPAIYYPGGYPIIVALTYALAGVLSMSRETAMTCLVGLSFIASCILLGFVSVRSGATRGAAIAVSAVWVLWPLAIWMFKQPNSECPFTPVLLAATWVFLTALDRERGQAPHLAACGLLSGVAMLIRPIGIGLPAVFGLCWLILRRRRTTAAGVAGILALAAGAALVVAPWQVVIYRHGGGLEPLARAGSNAIKYGLTFGAREGVYRGTWVPSRVKDLMERMDERGDQLDTKQGIRAALVEEWRRDSTVFVDLGLFKALRAWYGTDSQRREVLVLLLHLPILLVYGAGILMWVRGARGPSGFVALLLLLYFWFMTVLTSTIARYMIPVSTVMVAVFGGIVFDHLVLRFARQGLIPNDAGRGRLG